jgi:hypothetical protein
MLWSVADVELVVHAGIDSPKVMSYIDVLRHKKPVGQRVAVVGAGAAAFTLL